MSDTPRTELMVERAPIGLRTNVAFEQSCDLCRQLERELNEANAIIRQQQLLHEENLRLQDRIKRLEEAGDELMYDNDDMENINRWHKAKDSQ